MSSNMEKGIFIIDCLLEPPYGGISKYLTFSLPIISKKIPIYGITQREYPNYSNKEVNLPNFKTKLIKRKSIGLVALPLIILKYFHFFRELLFKYHVPLKDSLKTIYYWLPETDKFLGTVQESIKYIHVYDNPSSTGAIGMLLSKKYKIPLLITTFGELVPHKHEIDRLDDYSTRFKKISTEVLQYAHKISSPTKYCRSLLSEHNISESKVHLTYHVCDVERYSTNENRYSSILEKYPQLRNKRCVLFVGQMLKRKAPDLVLKAAKEIKNLDPNVIFVFIGPDLGFYQTIKKLAVEFNLDGQCLFPGVVPDKELLEFYSFADIFVFTTISKIECLGLVFVQAMLSGCAVVASSISGVPEVIRHGDNGLLYEPGNFKDLSIQLQKVLNDESLKNRLKSSAKSSVLKQFDEKIVIQQIIDFYK